MSHGRSFDLKSIIVTVGTVTYAIKLRRLLLRAGIRSKLVKVDSTDSSGCTHGVQIAEGDYYSAVVVMQNGGIQYKVFDGRYHDIP